MDRGKPAAVTAGALYDPPYHQPVLSLATNDPIMWSAESIANICHDRLQGRVGIGVQAQFARNMDSNLPNRHRAIRLPQYRQQRARHLASPEPRRFLALQPGLDGRGGLQWIEDAERSIQAFEIGLKLGKPSLGIRNLAGCLGAFRSERGDYQWISHGVRSLFQVSFVRI